jgi:drug/metabolite transporter (DMT)-like permease
VGHPVYSFIFKNGFILLCLAMLGWAGNTVAGRMSTGEISPMVVVFLRWFIISTFLILFLNKKLILSFNLISRKLVWLCLMGSLGLTGFNALFYIAAQNTTAINLGIIQGIMPAIILVGSVIIFKEAVNFTKVTGLIIAFFGVVVVVSRGDYERVILLSFNYGDLVMLCACFFYSGFTLGLKNKPVIDPIVLMTYFSLSALIFSIPLLIIEYYLGLIQVPATSTAWLTILYIAFVPSFLAQIFFIRGVELVGASKAGLFINFLPIFAAILGVLLLGERLFVYHLISLFIVLLGVYLFMVIGDKEKNTSY